MMALLGIVSRFGKLGENFRGISGNRTPEYQPVRFFREMATFKEEKGIRRWSFSTRNLELPCYKSEHTNPQMTRGRTLENALASKGISKEFKEWIAIAKDRPKWRQQTHSKPKPPDA